MRIWHGLITAFLLFPLNAAAQQTINPNSSRATEQLPSSDAPPAPGMPIGQFDAQPPKVLPRLPAASASVVPAPRPSDNMDSIVDRALEREHALIEMLKTHTPFVETYLQDLKFRPQEGPVPVRDHYFLGRMDLSDMARHDYIDKRTSFESRLLGGFTGLFAFRYKPLGFSWMIYADRDEFNRQTYDFKYARHEFLGDVRCILFDVFPKKGTGHGRFRGQVWVEEQDYNIVRLNGTYEPTPRASYFFHMDSWRLNLIPGYWLPVYVYSEEGDFSDDSKPNIAFKA